MAKFPRSNRKRFQLQYKPCGYAVINYGNYVHAGFGSHWEVWGAISENKWGILAFFETKKEARQYIASRRRAIKNRLW